MPTDLGDGPVRIIVRFPVAEVQSVEARQAGAAISAHFAKNIAAIWVWKRGVDETFCDAWHDKNLSDMSCVRLGSQTLGSNFRSARAAQGRQRKSLQYKRLDEL